MNELIQNFHVKIGSDPKLNAQIKKKVSEALELELAELNSSCSDKDGDLSDVFKLLFFLLKFVIGTGTSYLTSFLESTVKILFEGTSTGLSEHGIIGGLLGAVRGLIHGLTAGTLAAESDYVKNLYT